MKINRLWRVVLFVLFPVYIIPLTAIATIYCFFLALWESFNEALDDLESDLE